MMSYHNNLCFNINYLSLENSLINIMIENFPYLQTIHLSTSEKGHGFLMLICGFTVAVKLCTDSCYLFD